MLKIILFIVLCFFSVLIAAQDFKDKKVSIIFIILHLVSLSLMLFLFGYKYICFIPIICIPFLFTNLNIIDYLYLILTILCIFITSNSIYKMILLMYPIGVLMFSKEEKIPFLGVCCPLISALFYIQVFVL